MSSIEPDDGGSEANSGEEAASGFVMAGGDSPVLLEFGGKILDRASGLIEFPVIRARRLPVLFRWDNHRLSGLERGHDHLLVVIMPVVDEDGFRLKVGKKRV